MPKVNKVDDVLKQLMQEMKVEAPLSEFKRNSRGKGTYLTGPKKECILLFL